MNELFTFTGVPAGDFPAPLAESLTDHCAYKSVPGGADLTGINAVFMLAPVTAVFGHEGIG